MVKLKLDCGGKCVECGYNRCLDVLEFHHLDTTQKFNTVNRLMRISLGAARREAKKCILVCANCHREHHAGLIDLAKWRMV